MWDCGLNLWDLMLPPAGVAENDLVGKHGVRSVRSDNSVTVKEKYAGGKWLF